MISFNCYAGMINFFKRNKPCNLILKICYNFLPLVVFISYGLLIAYMLFTDLNAFAKITLAPLTVFLLITISRKIFNRKRPYEKFGIPSVFNKDKKGESMPSRHTASAFIIAMAFLYVNVPLGIIFLAISVLIMISRVLAGVHFISDVIVGMSISLLFGWFLLFII